MRGCLLYCCFQLDVYDDSAFRYILCIPALYRSAHEIETVFGTFNSLEFKDSLLPIVRLKQEQRIKGIDQLIL